MRRIVIAAALLLASLVASPSARADSGARDEGWEAVNGGMMVQPGESYQATHLVAGAYGFIWLMVAGFVYSVWRRAGALERDVAELRRRIEAGSGGKRAV